MTEQPAVPEFDLADRMRKSLRHAGISVADMADYLGVSRQSVGNWTGGRTDPDTRTLRLWALRCGVEYQWLCTGLVGSYMTTYSTPARDLLGLAA
jgi:transcriptional regulator with XRE-family HTH domain